MAQFYHDRVMQYCFPANGIYTLDNNNLIPGFRTFTSIYAANNTVDVFVEEINANGMPTGNWETALATMKTSNLTRTTLIASSNGGAAVTWGFGAGIRQRIGLAVTQGTMIRLTDAITNGDAIVDAARIAGDAARVAKTGDIMTGDLFINSQYPSMVLRKTPGGGCAFFGQVGTTSRWQMDMGDAAAESGGNFGSNWNLHRFNDDGSYLGTPLSFARSTGIASFQNPPNSPLGYRAQGTGSSAIVVTNFEMQGNYRTTYLLDATVTGDTAFQLFYHYPGIESFWRWNVGPSAFSMSNNGVGSSPGGWVATSDMRVKSNKTVIDTPLARNRKLTGYTYDRTDMISKSGKIPRRSGILAQDALLALPEAVNVPRNYDAATNTGDMLAVFPDAVPALHVECIKVLEDQLNALAARITNTDALTARVTTLEAQNVALAARVTKLEQKLISINLPL